MKLRQYFLHIHYEQSRKKLSTFRMRIYINIKTELDLLLLDFRLIIEAFLFNIKLICKIDNCKSESEDF